MTTPYLQLQHLARTYPRRPEPAVCGITLEVGRGELLALLGPSGSGKSTVLKLIAGIEHPDAGDILLDGRSLLPVPANRRGAVLMFQKSYLFPFLSVFDNVAFGLKVQRVPAATIRAEVARMLDLVELPGIERRMPGQLSGGEQQRVALARALIVRPRLLMLDEPLSSLDPQVRQTLQEAIRRIQRELGITALLVTHDLSEAVAMADRVALLARGRLTALDTPRGLFQRPPTRAAARFVGVSAFLSGQLEGGVLATELGPLAVDAPEGVARPATFAIRPEHLRLLDAPAPNTLPVLVAGAVYRGESIDLEVRVGAQTLRVRLYGGEPPAPGAAVHLLLPPEHLFEVREE
ncbi:MAG TPA: ABC transporter ATP-binding protein [Roseiflexaceae bacterium]|nr:ABC transporter ATP-binding protein [Roseiflexaceae bacterium]